MGIGVGVASRLVMWFSPRVVVIAGSILVLGAMLDGSTLHRGVPYFPNLVLPLVVGAIGIGVINVPLWLSLIASVDFDRIGPAGAIALMLQILGGPVVLVVIQAVITSRTLQLGGTKGPVKFINAAQLHALDRGYTYGLLWLGGVVILLGGWRCSSATPRSRWRARRKSRKPSTTLPRFLAQRPPKAASATRNTSSGSKRSRANVTVAIKWPLNVPTPKKMVWVLVVPVPHSIPQLGGVMTSPRFVTAQEKFPNGPRRWTGSDAARAPLVRNLCSLREKAATSRLSQ